MKSKLSIQDRVAPLASLFGQLAHNKAPATSQQLFTAAETLRCVVDDIATLKDALRRLPGQAEPVVAPNAGRLQAELASLREIVGIALRDKAVLGPDELLYFAARLDQCLKPAGMMEQLLAFDPPPPSPVDLQKLRLLAYASGQRVAA